MPRAYKKVKIDVPDDFKALVTPKLVTAIKRLMDGFMEKKPEVNFEVVGLLSDVIKEVNRFDSKKAEKETPTQLHPETVFNPQ